MSEYPRRRMWPVVALCLALALGGQAMADSLVPEASGAETVRVMGRAASSYLSGLKTFAAAVLWNRVDPLLHNYYEDVPIEEQLYMLTTIALVEELDPHLVHPYYVGSWVLVRNGRIKEGLEMAERGVEANPDAGILYVNLAQIQMLYAHDLEAAVETAEQVLERPMKWTDAVEEHNAYPILGAIFRAAGRDDLYAKVQEELERLDTECADELQGVEHDHDHDGVPDH